MLLRSLVVASPGSRRRRIVTAVDALDCLVRSTESVDGMREDLRKRPCDLLVIERESLPKFGADIVREIRADPEAPEILILVDDEDPEEHASLIAAGCWATVSDGIGESSLSDVLASMADRRRQDTAASSVPVPDADYQLGDYVTQSPAMRSFLRSAKRVADLDSTLLILGETGVGKGLFARSMHNEGPRGDKPFVSINCGALNETLLESELFGHERGAFTGADRARRGHFEMAHTGTIFLDEIGEMPLHIQVKLLNVLEDRVIQPLGSEKTVSIDVRIMAATSKNLEVEAEANRFRSDLYYRLNVISLTLPSLADRTEDIPELAQSYVDHFRAKMGCHVMGVRPDALRALTRYPWPGNLREFINSIERAVIMTVEDEIRVDDLPLRVQEFAPLEAPLLPVAEIAAADDGWLDESWSHVRRRVLDEAEVRYLTGLLNATGGRIGETARRAGMDPRSIREKMKRYGLQKEDFK